MNECLGVHVPILFMASLAVVVVAVAWVRCLLCCHYDSRIIPEKKSQRVPIDSVFALRFEPSWAMGREAGDRGDNVEIWALIITKAVSSITFLRGTYTQNLQMNSIDNETHRIRTT